MATCSHLDTLDFSLKPSADGCEDCLAIGSRWVHLRMCQECGHVGCCESLGAHNTAHYRDSGHAVIRSQPVGEGFTWCYECNAYL